MTSQNDAERRVREKLRGLSEILEAEIAAIDAVDYSRAAEFAERKRAAAAELAAEKDASARLAPTSAAAMRVEFENAERLVARNARALERAIYVQRRLIDVFGRAAAKCARPQQYGGDGSLAASPAQPPMAFIARA